MEEKKCSLFGVLPSAQLEVMNSWSREAVQASIPQPHGVCEEGMEQGRDVGWCRTGLSSAERGREEYEMHIAPSRITVAPDHFGTQWHHQGLGKWYCRGIGIVLITSPTTVIREKQGVSKLADAKPD